MKKYHVDIYMPETFLSMQFATLLRYTRHALEAAKGDRYGQINLPKVLDTRHAELVEVSLPRGKRQRSLWRQWYDDQHDLCIVLEHDAGVVVTVWLNQRDDQHATLREEDYATA